MVICEEVSILARPLRVGVVAIDSKIRVEHAIVLEETMDTLENQHKPEEVPDFASKPHKQFPEEGAQRNVQKDGDTQLRFEQRWKRLAHWLRASTFTPEW